MTRQSRYGWRWFLVLFGGLAWLSIGCSPQTLTMFLMPFDDNKTQPEYKIFEDNKKDIRLAVVSHFEHRPFQPEIMPAEQELADSVSDHLRKRCQENKHPLKLVPQAEVRNFQLRQLAEDGGIAPVAIGKKFKADFVLDLNIENFELYQKGSVPRMFGGNAQINIALFKTNVKDESPEVWKNRYRTRFVPNKGISFEVGNNNPADFRQMFMSKIGKEISRMLIAFDPDELKAWDAQMVDQ